MASQRCARYTATVSDERSYPSSSRRHASYGGESFGVTAVGTGGVPAASFTAGDRVGSFVDDGVVAVALAGHVSLLVDVLLGSGRQVPAVEHIGRSGRLLQVGRDGVVVGGSTAGTELIGPGSRPQRPRIEDVACLSTPGQSRAIRWGSCAVWGRLRRVSTSGQAGACQVVCVSGSVGVVRGGG